MANKIFVSPGVFTSEKDLTFISQQVGVTTLGLVGETVKGPAFEPIFITDYEEFTAIFGGLNSSKFGGETKRPKYELPYVAKSYLSESNQLFVSRILGLTGYYAGKAWLITADVNYDPDTIGETGTLDFTATYSGGTVFYSFAGAGAAQAEYLYSLGLLDNGSLSQTIPSDTITYPEGKVLDKLSDTSFSGTSATMVNTTGDSSTGTTSGTVTTYSASTFSGIDGTVLAMLRSRGDVSSDDTLTFRTSDVQIGVGNASTDPEASFTLSATSTSTSAVTQYTVSLDTSSRDYITRVLGTSCFDKEELIFVEEHYPNMLTDMIDNGYIRGINATEVETNEFNNYQQSYQTPETPWVVSEIRGSVIDKLFKFVSISDGDTANQEIKISITNIRPDTKEFDIVVRDFNDTDRRPVILERFSKCVMDTTSDAYVARRVGTADGENVLRSRYIMLVVNPEAPIDAFPAGFDGYIVRDYNSAVAPYVPYKTAYDINNEKIRKVYLGISDVKGIDQNMFNWKGYTNNSSPNQWTSTTKGFHMDSGATSVGEFMVGSSEFRTSAGIEGTDYEGISARKFTLVPYLGFDGWNCYRKERTNTDRYRIGKTGWEAGVVTEEFSLISPTEGTSDYYAYLSGVRTFENPEAVNINILSTPGIDYEDHTDLVSETIDMIEEERADSIYIVSSPEGIVYDTTSVTTGIGFDVPDLTTVDDIVGRLEDADIDSNYTATYWPWIQMRDNENDVNIWLPPTVEVVRNLALTDNVSFPWFASAGYTRGLTNAIQARTKLTEEQRDVLYEGRINPMATFSDQGVIIWGNKNLQIKDSVLNRLNVRRLLLQTRKLISAVAVRLLFEQNDQIVRNQFNNLIQPILDNIRRERGIVDFRVQISDDPEEIDRNEMRGKIFIKPIPSLEFIDLEFVVTPTGASFDDI